MKLIDLREMSPPLEEGGLRLRRSRGGQGRNHASVGLTTPSAPVGRVHPSSRGGDIARPKRKKSHYYYNPMSQRTVTDIAAALRRAAEEKLGHERAEELRNDLEQMAKELHSLDSYTVEYEDEP